MVQKRKNSGQTFFMRTEDIEDDVFGSMDEMVSGRSNVDEPEWRGRSNKRDNPNTVYLR